MPVHIRQVAEVAIVVTDLDRSVRFSTEVLGIPGTGPGRALDHPDERLQALSVLRRHSHRPRCAPRHPGG
jgi:catechol 2,3-dioxygenase-like lactoylglutathione lyase family enzyme